MAIDKFLVEASHIMMFARSVGDANPIYHDEEYAKGTDSGGIIAPPTFCFFKNSNILFFPGDKEPSSTYLTFDFIDPSFDILELKTLEFISDKNLEGMEKLLTPYVYLDVA